MKLSNLIPSPVDYRDYMFVPHLGPYADAIDQRSQASPVDDQGQESDCTGEAVVNGCERFSIANGLPFIDLSRQFPYDITGEWENFQGQPGRFLRDAIKCAHQLGLPPEDIYPYRGTDAWQRPSDPVIALAGQRKIGRYERIDMTDDWPSNGQAQSKRIWASLDRGDSVLIGLDVGEQIFHITGPLEQQEYGNVNPQTNPFRGRHAMWLSGKLPGQYGAFHCKQSWGLTVNGQPYGDAGYIKLDQAVMTNVFEAWAIVGFGGVDPTTAAKHSWAMLHETLVRQYINAHMATPQDVIDGAIEYALTADEVEAIMSWERHTILIYSQNDPVGKTLDWRGFNW